MAVLYVTTQGAVVSKRGNTLAVEKDGASLGRVHVHNLEAVLLFGRAHLTTDAVRLLLGKGIETAFLTRRGRLLGKLTPPKSKNAILRIRQMATYEDDAKRVPFARAFVAGKLAGAALVLRAFASNHPGAGTERVARELDQAVVRSGVADSLAALRGFEGSATRRYFDGLSRMCLGDLPFAGRNRRPPRDPMNALLSFGYVLVGNELQALLDARGFDPYIGLYHDIAYGRPSLALDLLEEFRHTLVDRFTISLNNRREFSAGDFEVSERVGCRLKPDALRRYFGKYEEHLAGPATDPSTGDAVSYRGLFRRQAERLSSALREGRAYRPHTLAGPETGDG